MVRLFVAIKSNPRSSLTHLNLGDNFLDDKGNADHVCSLLPLLTNEHLPSPAVEALGGAIETLTHGLQELTLSNCRLTPRSASIIATAMKANKNMQYSLVHLDLSANALGPDPQGGLAFIKEPQTISHLNLSKCGLNFEFVSLVSECRDDVIILRQCL